MRQMLRPVPLAMLLLMTSLSEAATDPLDPESAVSETSYISAFENYVADDDPEPTDWREANDRVGEIGGWRTYSRQAQETTGETETSPVRQAPATHTMPTMQAPGSGGPQ